MKIALITCILITTLSVSAQTPNRTIAITMDDLPVASTRTDLKNRQEITRKILGHVKKANVPIIGFVNEGKLYDQKGKLDQDQVALLRNWIADGFPLGNHTYSHVSINAVSLADYEADFLKGEAITKLLMAEVGQPIRYFRHPYLNTGRTMEKKAELAKFLADHNYTIAPITLDDADYIFSAAYDKAFDKGDKALMKKVGEAYVPYMEANLIYWEKQSKRLFGREISQTLLIHANFINSDYLGDLIKMYKQRGYTLVTLDDALKDDAYKLPDTYLGPAGISWMHRWALERGKGSIEPNEPGVPNFVMKASGFDSP
jgi:peptidoglycan/xylan/chitin deacetylase (PgdA/CDA1 family)